MLCDSTVSVIGMSNFNIVSEDLWKAHQSNPGQTYYE